MTLALDTVQTLLAVCLLLAAGAVATVVVPAVLMADTRSTGSEVRNLLDVLFATDFVRAGSLHGAMISPKTAPDAAGLPFHAGALDYYASGRPEARQ